ncbi:MAG: hypothetical protein EBZ48_17440, partial [Proteobacteria bacterium]|nr:hypothetical protein [Pseudomonadota bacterium]
MRLFSSISSSQFFGAPCVGVASRAVLGVFLLLLVGCAPRGETKSLQEVLDIARNHYVELTRAQESETLKGTLIELARNLEDMVSANGAGAQVAQASGNVASKLSQLVHTAGYTSRASIGEILLQHRVLVEDATRSEVNGARVKLLVARTYSVISSEVETTKFAVE